MSRPRAENFKTWNTREVGVIVRRNRPTKRERCRGYLQIPDANCKTGAGDMRSTNAARPAQRETPVACKQRARRWTQGRLTLF
jgi:hypothetical protein